MQPSDSQEPPPGRTTIRAILSTVFVFAFLFFCARYVDSHWKEFYFLKAVSIPRLMVAAGLVLASYLLTGYQLGLFLSKFGLRVGSLELMALTASMMLGNLILPMRSGTAGLAVYLRKVHHLNFESFALIYGGTAVLVALINSAAAAAALGYLALMNRVCYPLLILLTGGALFGSLYLILAPLPGSSKNHGVLGILARVSLGWQAITRDHELMKALTASTILIWITLVGAFYFIYESMGTLISFSAIVMTASIGNIANLVPLTPGSLGVFDAATIQIPALFGIGIAQSLAATMLWRSLCFGWAFLLGIPGSLYLMKKKISVSHRNGEDR